MIHLIIGESGCGKSTLFSALDSEVFACVDADKRKKDWASLSVMVDEAVATGKCVVVSITRGITTFMKYRPDLQYRLYYIDVPLETIIENRQKRVTARSKPIDPERIKARMKRLDSIFRNYGQDGVRGSYADVLAAFV
jgi:guanylate kinase